MDSRIQPYNRSAMLYAPATTRQDAPERMAPQASPPAAPPRPSPAAATADVQGALTSEEQTMIDRYFPASSSMSLRLYGPGQQRQTLNPTALGSRLDFRA